MSRPTDILAESAPVCEALLTHEDEVWLTRLTDEDINDTWLGLANSLIVVGLANDRSTSRKLSTTTSYARDYFYEDLLGFARPESPSYGLDAKFVAKQQSHAPLDRFVGTMRLYNRQGLDVLKASRSLPETWSLRTETMEARIIALQKRLGNVSAQRLLQTSARPLASPDYVNRIDPFMQVTALGSWTSDQAKQLLELRPTLVNNKDQRLFLLSRYVLTFGARDITPSQAGNLMLLHPDRHLVALDIGMPKYTHSYISKATRELSATDCAELAHVILEKPDIEKQFDPKIVHAHRRFHHHTEPSRAEAA